MTQPGKFNIHIFIRNFSRLTYNIFGYIQYAYTSAHIKHKHFPAASYRHSLKHQQYRLFYTHKKTIV